LVAYAKFHRGGEEKRRKKKKKKKKEGGLGPPSLHAKKQWCFLNLQRHGNLSEGEKKKKKEERKKKAGERHPTNASKMSFFAASISWAGKREKKRKGSNLAHSLRDWNVGRTRGGEGERKKRKRGKTICG